MASSNEPAIPNDEERTLIAHMLAERCPFGPRFFLTQLVAFVRERCPGPGELPRVDLWIDGEPRALCHVITLAPRWMAIAVWSGRGHDATMHTEIVPYELISRVTIGAGSHVHGIGFQQLDAPTIIRDDGETPLRTLDRLARPPLVTSGAEAGHDGGACSSTTAQQPGGDR